jgi:hypothetical protein
MCRERLLNDSRIADADLFNFWWPDVALPQLSLYRCFLPHARYMRRCKAPCC